MTDDRSGGASSAPATFPFRGRFASKGPGPASTANIANVVTVVRILMAPLFIAWLLVDDGADGPLRIAAAVLFVVAILTDSLDGALARGLDLVTDFGKIVDPIADKVLIGGALVSLTVLGELPWWVTALILLREVGITVYRFIVIRDRVVPASRGGKLKTVLQAVAVTLALFPLWNVFGEAMHWVNGVLMTAALVATLVSGADYLRVAAKHGRGA
ncbi:CDP-diacylglycerol--glycerol-3-phosphate 3-phosphatidyltransferase [Frigoribacterium sp. PvP120]|jgi:CDP-diacylglycerol--glycerol-3-phosphate 3-phosphatidyltransferase|uniref:CDP-diacylglycerol--glycerol-3-phosphate 3-phosphatidyltransferase n=1 Tax=unclassified Frigoribacterium TaxID=2627005 RepID=UPI001AE657DD|nr:CDP-diacylglycerol--glycerol-3-phosphate 3-phosphatidyltransferase [Frigoribacterium sp. PvP121]MBP1242211.1 CDP-diacylglycerol--glycerol-3-phosphate 3-phosphatidyltransferase [Frigoribacterium sp. PvP121]